MINPVQVIWLAVVLAIIVVLTVLHHRWKGDSKKIRIWRFLCFLPLFVAGIHALIYLSGTPLLINGFFPLYVIGISVLILIPFAKRKIGYRIAAVLTGLIVGALVFYFMGNNPMYFNHAGESYTESFHLMIEDMERYYVLKEWKDVDFEELEVRYMPLVQDAQAQDNPAMFADAVTMFCNELHDGHVMVQYQYDEETYRSAFTPREYGFSMIELDNGEVIAVCTTAEARNAGIHDGTVITGWNGKDIESALAQDVPNMGSTLTFGGKRHVSGMSVQSNADRLAAIYLSGIGGRRSKFLSLMMKGQSRPSP